jgi:uncharacterized Zn finger protein (UPF0148 family)
MDEVGVCEECGTPMTIIWPGQLFHPLCERDEEETEEW